MPALDTHALVPFYASLPQCITPDARWYPQLMEQPFIDLRQREDVSRVDCLCREQ
jgi:hypothetical protein